jgi:hypothetical protein
MEQHSTRFASYMAENVPTSRWELYRLRFLFLFVAFLAIDSMGRVFDNSAAIFAAALVSSLGVCVVIYLSERYRGRHERTEIVVLLVLLVIALAIVWRGIERHRHNVLMNSSPTISHP